MALTSSAISHIPVPIHLADHEDDENRHQKSYIKATDYSLPYVSQWTRVNQLDETQKKLLRNLNCSWLSTHGSPPTLLALKQHAQSLCILIHALCPTVRSAEINCDAESIPAGPASAGTNAGPASGAASATDPLTMKYELNDAFDFLADLSRPYENHDPNHLKPLNFLVNDVRKRDEATGTEYHCPFAESTARGKGEKARPYASHHNLLIHANACLERLDHEFSATGGLVSILPTDQEHDTEELKDARNSLLGSWILFTQHIVARMHEMERSYANALDALAGEAAIPRQYVSNMGSGPDGRSVGREIAYPQDRWILANSGDDVFKFVHQLLDKQEAMSQVKEKVHKGNGAASSHNLVLQRNGDEYMRGIAHVDIKTRYYRLMGQGHTTIFVLPAWEHHPGIEYTRKIEGEPTIVASVQPKWPVRATEFEQKYNERLQRASKLEQENLKITRRAEHLEVQVQTLEADAERERALNSVLVEAAGKDNIGKIEQTDGLESQIAHYIEERERFLEYRQLVEKANDGLRAEREILQGKLRSLGAYVDAKLQQPANDLSPAPESKHSARSTASTKSAGDDVAVFGRGRGSSAPEPADAGGDRMVMDAFK
ncbi:hypothetical protein GQ53DRAFT_785996 [Thozetella sp. PMI_491]|nr:hypothetical protein GQ53DRAFT_785996 [Thozetella sp. PMI_491]